MNLVGRSTIKDRQANYSSPHKTFHLFSCEREKYSFSLQLQSPRHLTHETIKVQGGCGHSGKAFIMRFVFGYFESRKFESQLKDKATVDAHWDMSLCPYYTLFNIRVYLSVIIIFQRGPLRCSFYCDGQCESLEVAGRVTGTDSRAFLFLYAY